MGPGAPPVKAPEAHFRIIPILPGGPGVGFSVFDALLQLFDRGSYVVARSTGGGLAADSPQVRAMLPGPGAPPRPKSLDPRPGEGYW